MFNPKVFKKKNESDEKWNMKRHDRKLCELVFFRGLIAVVLVGK